MKATHALIPSLLLISFVACADPGEAQAVGQSGHSQAGMVSAAHPLAVEAGVRALEAGGNAADAAVASAFALSVVEPTMSSIAGRIQILLRRPDGSFAGIDGTTQAPWDYDYDTAPQARYGYPVIGVPGTVAGLMRLHSEHGSLPLSTLMAPAIDYAENGFRVLPGAAARQAAGFVQAVEFPGTVEAFYRGDSTVHAPGDLLRQPVYANTLLSIAEGGREVFYEGEIARRMADDLAANGSALTLQAFKDYEALDAKVVRGGYRGYELVGTDIPAAGVLAIQALQVLEHFDPSEMTEAEWFALVGQALGIASGELRALGSDTASARALSKEWASEVAQRLAAPATANIEPEPDGLASIVDGLVQPANRVPAPTGSRASAPAHDGSAKRPESMHTTHLSTADADGMFVSLTQTLGPNMGSKVVTPGLGFLYASTLGGYLGRMEPGQRARSNICPFMVVKDGEVILVLGAAGGGMIPPAVVHAVTRVIDFGMPLPQALAEPRVAGSGAGISAETAPIVGWTASELEEMRALGLQVLEVQRSGAYGRVHGIQYDPATGVFVGAADPDWEGAARGPGGRSR